MCEILQSRGRQFRVKNRLTRNLLITNVRMSHEVQSVDNEQKENETKENVRPVRKSLCRPRVVRARDIIASPESPRTWSAQRRRM